MTPRSSYMQSTFANCSYGTKQNPISLVRMNILATNAKVFRQGEYRFFFNCKKYWEEIVTYIAKRLVLWS